MLRSTPKATAVAGIRTQGEPPPYARGMDVSAGSVSEVVACYTDALQCLIERLEAQVAWNGTLIADLDRDAPLPDALAKHDSAQVSLAMTNALAEFDRARFDMRVSVAQALRDLGMANTEIAGVFGVSRQLVHRILAG